MHRLRRAPRLVGAVVVSAAALAGIGRALPDRAAAASPPPVATATKKTATKKGVDAWVVPGVDRSLRRSGAGWFLTWSTSDEGIHAPGARFVPMIWGSGSVTPSALAEAEHAGPDLLTFNEPDMAGQADMTVAQALSLWPKLEATGLQLASPAVADDAATPGGWLDGFMRGAAARHYRVDFIAVHWYGGDFATAAAVSQLGAYLVAVHDRYHLPVWLTEYSLINFGGGTMFPTGAQQAAFVTASARMLDGLPWLRRYAWFALPTSGARSTGLFGPGAVVTAAGRAFEHTP